MWPYTEAMRTDTTGYRVERYPDLPPEVLDYHIRRGRELRAEATVKILERLASAFRRLLRWVRSRELADESRSVPVP